MATNCEDVSAQMVDLLYGELPADARARVDVHVAGCARCRGELEGFEKARALARRGLDEAPPARARAAIMQAAAAHLAAQAQPAARKPAVPERISFWDRIRARWAFPTFATIGALAVFLVANRVFMNPERTLERASGSAAAPEAPAEPSPAPVAPAGAPRGAEAINEGKTKADLPLAKSAEAPSAAGASERRPAHAAKPFSDPFAGRADDYRGPAKDAAKKKVATKPMDRFAAAPPPAPAPERASRDEGLARQFAPPPPPRESQAAPRPAKEADKAARMAQEEPSLDAVTTKSASGGEAEKLIADRSGGGLGAVGGLAGGKNKPDGFGSGAAQAAPAARPGVAQNQTSKAAPSAPVAAVAPPAPASPPPQQQPKRRARTTSAEPAAADESTWAGQDLDVKAEKKQASGKGSAVETLLQRAERLFAEGRWAEAAAAYRELLRRDPHNDDAERWRRRLVAAESADVNERNASLARRKAAEANQQRSADAEAPASRGKQAPAKAEKRAAPAAEQ